MLPDVINRRFDARRRARRTPDDSVKISAVPPDLTDEERDLLDAGLIHWGGPARMTDQLAAAIGFVSADAFYNEEEEIRRRIERGNYSALDARRALAATEIVFASDVVGAGVEWEIVTGLTDQETLRTLRGLQRKLIGFYNS
jgi:hypothetical protein